MIAACTALPASVPAKEKRPAGPIAPIGWLEIPYRLAKTSVAKEDLQRASRNLAQGLVIPVYKTKEKHGQTLARVGALNLETGSAELGWMGIDRSELKPAGNPIRRTMICCDSSEGPILTTLPLTTQTSRDTLCGKVMDLPRCCAMC